MNQKLKKLQALLLTSGGSIPKKRLMLAIPCREKEFEILLKEAREIYKETGIILIDDGAQLKVTTDPTLTAFLKETEKEEKEMPLSRASQETLAIIGYAGPITKSDLDYIRGVNTSYTLRRLLMRSLIRRTPGRRFSVTTELLQHMGLQAIEELPDYEEIRTTLLESIQSAKDTVKEYDT